MFGRSNITTLSRIEALQAQQRNAFSVFENMKNSLKGTNVALADEQKNLDAEIAELQGVSSKITTDMEQNNKVVAKIEKFFNAED